LVGAGGEIDCAHAADADLALDGVGADGGGKGFFLIASGLLEDLRDGGDGGVGEEVFGCGVGGEELTDFLVEFAIGPARFVEEGLALVGWLVQDQLEKAFDLAITLGCHSKDR